MHSAFVDHVRRLPCLPEAEGHRRQQQLWFQRSLGAQRNFISTRAPPIRAAFRALRLTRALAK